MRNNVQLASLVPQIAPNIDSLISRYEHGMESRKIKVHDDIKEDNAQFVHKTFASGKNKGLKNFKKGENRFADNARKKDQTGRYSATFCPGCFYLSQQLGTPVHFKHSIADCPRKDVTVKMLNMEDGENLTYRKSKAYTSLVSVINLSDSDDASENE